MASFLLRALCCLGKRPRDQTVPDESSRLIPTNEAEFLAGEILSQNTSGAVDLTSYKDRLETIVRSKEGIMVNVSSPLPFNLHNRPRAVLDMMPQGSYLTSLSRSASTSTFQESSQSPTHHHNPSRPRAPFRVRSGLGLTPLRSAPASSQSRSPSYSSELSSASEGRLEKTEAPAPTGVLGVRLVRVYDAREEGYLEVRGRAKGKRMDGAGMENGHGDEDTYPDGEIYPPAGPSSVESTSGFGELVPNAQDEGEFPGRPHVSISPASDSFEFRLKDVGALSTSWGD